MKTKGLKIFFSFNCFYGQLRNFKTIISALNKAYYPKIDENLIKSKAVVDVKIVQEYEKIQRKMTSNGFMIFNGEVIKDKIEKNPGVTKTKFLFKFKIKFKVKKFQN